MLNCKWKTIIMMMLCMLFLSVPSWAADVVASGYYGDPNVNDGQNVTWSLDNAGTLTISGTGNMAPCHSTATRPWNAHCNNIKSAVISEGITSISGYAFSRCKNLPNIEIPSTVTTIGYGAFASCSRLVSLTIPASVTSIEPNVFSGCVGLTSILVESGNKNYG